MPYKPKTDHPLGWTDTELKWLISTGMKASNLYKAMGYTGRIPSPAFLRRIEGLGYVRKGRAE